MDPLQCANSSQLTMKRNHHHRPVALVALIAAAALPINPAFGQQTAPSEAPSPVAEPAPAAASVSSVAPPARVFAPAQEVVQPVPPTPALEVAVPKTTAVAATPNRAATRAANPVSRAAPRAAPVAATPAPPIVDSAKAAASSAVGSEEVAPMEAETIAPAPEPVVPAPPTVDQRTSLRLWIAAAIGLVVALLGFLFLRRRRSEDELVYNMPADAPVDETGAAMPEVDLAKRPWIRLTLQPTRAQRSGDRQTVDYKLIVENDGQIPAHDVRVSSFLTGAKGTSKAAGLGIGQAETHHIDVEPGASVPLAGKVTVRDGSKPKIVADARYLLPDGGEGHIAARFGIDMSTPSGSAEVEDVLERV